MTCFKSWLTLKIKKTMSKSLRFSSATRLLNLLRYSIKTKQSFKRRMKSSHVCSSSFKTGYLSRLTVCSTTSLRLMMSSKVTGQKRRRGCVNSHLTSFRSSWTHMVAKRNPFSRTSLTRMLMRVKLRMKLKKQEILLLLKPSKTSSTIFYIMSWLMLVRASRLWFRKSPN